MVENFGGLPAAAGRPALQPHPPQGLTKAFQQLGRVRMFCFHFEHGLLQLAQQRQMTVVPGRDRLFQVVQRSENLRPLVLRQPLNFLNGGAQVADFFSKGWFHIGIILHRVFPPSEGFSR